MLNRFRVLADLLRVKQWIKNLLIFAALLFTGNIFNPLLLLKTITAFLLFSFTASALYIMNDLKDFKEDRLHPVKKLRPIASGAVPHMYAATVAGILIFLGLLGSYFLDFSFFLTVLSYAILTTLYTYYLKHVVILDVFEVALGFILRPIAGALVIGAVISPWLLICTTLLALFVILSKRRNELTVMEDAHKHRKILAEYSVPMLDQMINIVTASTVIAYSLYTFTSDTASRHHLMMLTIPFVLYGIFRYLYLTHKKNMGGAPEQIFLKDLPMIIDAVLWVVTSAAIIMLAK